ncbi:hypothetical protein DH2020_037891 [Rehmannia glutinosa]|uniref:Prolamin-like domain-containing protein n=1 Tax=Rehmannia glutinosa TaxID=99300 RepID=A0ABR0V040_REHGL
MIPTIIKTLTFLIINLQFLNESQAAQKSPPKVPSPSPLVPPQEKPDNYTPQYTQFLQARREPYVAPAMGASMRENNDGTMRRRNRRKHIRKRRKSVQKLLFKARVHGTRLPRGVRRRFPPREFRPDYEEFLEACAEKLTDKCGTEVVYAIFKKNKKVDKSCCKKLLKMGRECHDELIKGLRNLGEYAKDEKEVKAKSDHVWKHCQDITGDK